MIQRLRDPMSGLTHFVATLLAMGGLVVLLAPDAAHPAVTRTIAVSVFGGAMILLYATSTLYHWLPLTGKNRALLRKLDHIMIFVFIAASYTPVCLLTLKGAWGWSIMAGVWGLAVIGFFMKVFWIDTPRKLYTAVYILMGWVIVIAIWPLSQLMSSAGLTWMAVGGIFYTTGAVIYALKRPDPWPRRFGFHEIFHVFIMLGSFAHFWMVYRHV